MDQATIPTSLLERYQRPALIIGAIGLLASLASIFINGMEYFTQGYLTAYLFWLGLSLGGLTWAMINNVVGGRWGLATRRIWEAMALCLLLMAGLFIPILIAVLAPLIGLGTVYEWSNPQIVAEDPILQWKAPYLNVPFFIVRVLIYFGIWMALAYFLNKWSLEQERTGGEEVTAKMRRLSAGGIIAYAFTLNFAMTDWGMSLEPHWFSTMYVVIFAVGQLASALALIVFILTRLIKNRVITSPLVSADHFHDLGKLMLAFVILWTYTSFSQFLIIWSGNISEFASYYIYRFEGGWQFFFPILAVLNFIFPLFFLLSRNLKRRLGTMAFIALYLIALRIADLYYTIVPAFQWAPDGGEHVFVLNWVVFTAYIGIGGLWTWYLCRVLKDRPLLILREPRMVELYGERATGTAGATGATGRP
jgi:hypothetical protein